MSARASIKCRIIARMGPGVAGGKSLPPKLAAHAGSCLNCQVELGRYRKLHRELVALAQVAARAPAGLGPAVDASIIRPAAWSNVPSTSRPVAAIASATAAAASVVAVAVWRRSRAIA